MANLVLYLYPQNQQHSVQVVRSATAIWLCPQQYHNKDLYFDANNSEIRTASLSTHHIILAEKDSSPSVLPIT